MTSHDYERFEAARAKRRGKLSQWLSRNPLSAFHDRPVWFMRWCARTGTLVRVLSGGESLRARTAGEQLPIAPPIISIPDPIPNEQLDLSPLTNAA